MRVYTNYTVRSFEESKEATVFMTSSAKEALFEFRHDLFPDSQLIRVRKQGREKTITILAARINYQYIPIVNSCQCAAKTDNC